ncbi:ATP-binding cassette transporter [Reticulomyxa filosa]|uniref:ATP-binding cassette transporter n=1 Tax=Reticulomyxa filosa TaxID=46433 RepID=X6NV51_RETFI|nr:ATP-binding cassette transporter [Reticulomyxa filosa]|eukprot:ETO29157.1 ATP-binding cassette transporter [Reticulomyxa filosa]
MKLLKNLADQGKTVVASLHQPSSEIFSLLDRLIILARGEVVYDGKTIELTNYLDSIGYRCPVYSNVGDYVLQQIHDDVDTFINKWKQYSDRSKTKSSVPGLERQQSLPVTQSMVMSEKRAMASIVTQLYVISLRSLKIFIRDPLPTYVRFGQVLFTGVLEGLLWLQLQDLDSITNYNTATVNAQNRFGGIFYAVAFACMNAIMTVLHVVCVCVCFFLKCMFAPCMFLHACFLKCMFVDPFFFKKKKKANLTFPSQRLIFQKERASNWYYTWVWVLCKVFIDTPMSCLAMVPFAILIKYMVNFRADVVNIYISLTLCAIVADALGFFLGTIANRPELAIQISPVTIIPLMLFSNFFVATNTIPAYLRWIKWIDPFFYGTEIFSIDEFQGISTGEQLLSNYGIKSSDKSRDIYLMLALFFGLRLVGIVSLLWRNGW